jgi:hypothetical protein
MPIPPAYRLLHSGYDYLGILLDLYGECDSDGPQVYAAALVGDKRDLAMLLSESALETMTGFVERRVAEAKRKSDDEARAERVLDARADY